MQPYGGLNRSSRGKDGTVTYPLRAALLLVAAVSLTGCGVAAFPVRVSSAAVKVVPVAGDVVAYPLDKTADVID